jgi:hypothetical protein
MSRRWFDHAKKALVISLGCLSLLHPQVSMAQAPETWLEEWLESEEEVSSEIKEEQLTEFILLKEHLLAHPIDLNRADESQLLQTGLFHPAEVAALLAHRQKFGALLAWYELQAIAGFSAERLKALAPYCFVTPGHQQGSLWYSVRSAKHRLLVRSQRILEAQQGYDPARNTAGMSHYGGSAQALLLQYRQSGSRHSLALTASRDPGELGIDRIGGHFMSKSNGRLERFVIGDYQLQLGQGLVVNNGFTPGRSAGITGSYQAGSGVQGASGNQPFGIYRGVAARYRLHSNWHVLPWVFKMRWSASVASDFEDGLLGATSLQLSNRFRTLTERERRYNLGIQGAGIQLSYNRPQFGVHWQTQYLQTSMPLLPRPDLYQRFKVTGAVFLHSSVSHRWRNGKWQQFGEIALFQGQTPAVVQHLMLSASSKLHLQWSYRHYPAAYHSFFGNSLSAGSQLANEKGMLWQMTFEHNRKNQFDYYIDLYQHPWLRFRVNAPSQALDQRLQWSHQPNRNSRLWVRLRHSVRERNLTENAIAAPVAFEQWRLSTQWSQQIDEQWQVQLRADRHTFEQNSPIETAFVLSYRLKWQNGPWRISWQQAQFDAENFDNRFYLSEPDVLYAQGMGMLSGQGLRSVLLVQYRYKRGLDFWVRYSSSRFSDRSSVGSGLEASKGNKRSELRVQAQYRF